MRSSRAWIENRILLILDRSPCHGYELQQALPPEASATKLTTLYRWLHDMEKKALVNSEVRPGPHGPDRRVYSLGPRGESKLRSLLRESIGVVLHFYDAYRHLVTGEVLDEVGQEVFEEIDGHVLFSAFPRATRHDVKMAQLISSKSARAPIHVLGECDVLRRAGIDCQEIEGTIDDIPARNGIYAEIWLSGVPHRSLLPRAIAECRRVLKHGGRLRLSAPFTFFQEPKEPTLGAFIRVTASHLFPDLGIVEGDEVGAVIESMFTDCGAYETFPGHVEFWAIKDQ